MSPSTERPVHASSEAPIRLGVRQPNIESHGIYSKPEYPQQPQEGDDLRTLNEAIRNPAMDPICLDQFLKLSSVAGTGGQAKLMIQAGEVKVNGAIETRRRRKLVAGDFVEVAGQNLVVKAG